MREKTYSSKHVPDNSSEPLKLYKTLIFLHKINICLKLPKSFCFSKLFECFYLAVLFFWVFQRKNKKNGKCQNRYYSSVLFEALAFMIIIYKSGHRMNNLKYMKPFPYISQHKCYFLVSFNQLFGKIGNDLFKFKIRV